MKTVGIIGGMGPGATLDLFRKIVELTPAKRDQDHLHLLIDNCPQIPDRTAFLTGNGESPLPYLLKAAERLERSGAQALCMPCNTAHFFAEEIRRHTAVPFISIIEVTIDKIVSTYPNARRIGLLATRGTYDCGIYHKALAAAGLEVLGQSEDFERQVTEVIYAVKAGKLTETLEPFKRCLLTMHAGSTDVGIVGCTELPLLLPHLESPFPLVDPTLALAEAVVKFARGEKCL